MPWSRCPVLGLPSAAVAAPLPHGAPRSSINLSSIHLSRKRHTRLQQCPRRLVAATCMAGASLAAGCLPGCSLLLPALRRHTSASRWAGEHVAIVSKPN